MEEISFQNVFQISGLGKIARRILSYGSGENVCVKKANLKLRSNSKLCLAILKAAVIQPNIIGTQISHTVRSGSQQISIYFDLLTRPQAHKTFEMHLMRNVSAGSRTALLNLHLFVMMCQHGC